MAAPLAWACGRTAAGTAAEIEWLIDLRAEIAAGRFDPERDTLGLRGAAPLNWGRSQPAEPLPGRPGWYRLRLALRELPTQPLAHKFKLEQPAQPGEGWEPGRNRLLQVGPGLQRVERAFGSETPVPPVHRSGHIERVAPRPSAFVAPRELQVWLPPGYASEPQRRYPVLYLHDGQNVFDHAAAGAEWQVDEAAQRGVLAGELAPMIIVAVASGETRVLDYTPVPVQRDGETMGGGAAQYGRYLIEELKPWVDARWRTLPGREHTAVGGSSLGGLVSMWLLLHHGSHFGSALVVSPSVWWAGRALLREVAARAQVLAGSPAPRIWLDVGGGEGADMVDGARALRDALAARSWPAHYTEAADAGHDEAAWALRVPAMLRHLYGRRP